MGSKEVPSYLPGFPSLLLRSCLCLKHSRLKSSYVGNTVLSLTQWPTNAFLQTLLLAFLSVLHPLITSHSSGQDFPSPRPFTCAVWNILHTWPVTILPGNLKRTAISFYFILSLAYEEMPAGTMRAQTLCSNQPFSDWI